MSGFPFAFLNPWILTSLAALPVLWFILRFMPPLPKKTFLPTARFLIGLSNNQTTPDTAPWWLILLRLLILACLIFAFAAPVYNPQKPSDSSGPLRLVFDNGWASAQVWDKQTAKADEILQNAASANRPVQLLFTATKNDNSFIRADQALARIRSAEPQSWPGDPLSLSNKDKAETIWISSGIAENEFYKAAENFAKNGLTVYMPEMKDRPALLRKADAPNSVISVETISGSGEKSINLQAFDAKGKLINQMRADVTGQSGGMDIIDDANLFTGKTIYQWKAPSVAGTGGVYLADISKGNASIGIDSKTTPGSPDFSDASFYLSRALENVAKIENGSIDDLIKKNVPVILLPDISSFSPQTLTALEKWIEAGGILLRFGGNNMSEADNALVPVPLRTGLRSLSGDMTWTKALKLSEFTKSSPFAGMALPDVTVEKQLLAEPSADLDKHVWAKLSDGTPFITAKPQGSGMIVLVHSTATPDWSDFVLSGFYVTFLKEILELSSLPDKSITSSASLQPSSVFDGWGRLIRPSGDIRSMTRNELTTLLPSEKNPPGIYTDGVRKFAFNLGDRLPPLDAIGALPANATSESLTVITQEKQLSSHLFLLAIILFLLDWLILFLSTRSRSFKLAAVILLLFVPLPVQAQNNVNRAESVHLACVKTSNDEACLKALQKLSAQIKMRTSIEMGDPVIADLDKDDLSFYPFLYWPIDPQSPNSPAMKENLKNYLNMGGMVLIDTRDGAYDTSQIIASPAVTRLRELLQGVDIPPLKPATKDHVLFKSFYLLNLYPEYDLTGKIWIEDASLPPEEKLSSVLITGEDWLSHWAYSSDMTDEEMSYRFGINLVMYSLTGNYKSDQVHMKAILERMGQ